MGLIRRKQLLALILAMDKADKGTYPEYLQVEGTVVNEEWLPSGEEGTFPLR
jgi:hypothetical protein